MDEKERQDRRLKDTAKLYQAIGEFVVKFELACLSVQTCIVFILHNAGLTDQRISQILLAGLTADPLRMLFDSLVAQTQKLNDKERKIIKNALNRFQKLTEERNDIVHSTWFIGYGDRETTDFSKASGMKYHKNGKGAVVKSFRRTAADFSKLSIEAKSLADIFGRLDGCFEGGHSVEKNFVVSRDGFVSAPPGTAS
ncbi:MAG TPA: hypothetical protein PKV48_01780 [Thermodesulfobacteriota bacterium]|nr:hypothetical protein [Thermodesulfobacteriota bacterium]